MEETVVIDILSALRFFDEKVQESRHQATAIVAVAGEEMAVGLLSSYLRQQGAVVDVLPDRCTQGTPKGVRLDKWIRVTREGNTMYFQTEIKNWSAHAIGGRVLKADATPEELAAHKKDRWQRQWEDGTFSNPSVRKVLTPMKEHEPHWNVEPLVCFWDAMHPTGDAEPLFWVSVDNSHFSRVWVFSMSAFLRQSLAFGTDKIELEMPVMLKRVGWLKRLFETP